MRKRVGGRGICAIAAVLLALGWTLPARADDGDPVRANFILLLPKYTTWPATAFASPTSPVVIAVVGDDALAKELSALAVGHQIEGRPVLIRAVASAAEAGSAHVIFLASPDDARDVELSPGLRVIEGRRNVRAGEIAFVMHGTEKVEFAVNKDGVKKRGLKLSSKLMRLASSFD